jgi:hypothetical protein
MISLTLAPHWLKLRGQKKSLAATQLAMASVPAAVYFPERRESPGGHCILRPSTPRAGVSAGFPASATRQLWRI